MEGNSRFSSVSEISEAMKKQTIQSASASPLHHPMSTQRPTTGSFFDPHFDHSAQELYDLCATGDSARKQKTGRISSEAPPKLGGDCSHGLPKFPRKHSKQFSSMPVEESTQPIDIAQAANRSKQFSSRQRLRKQKSWSTETDREEAWERRKDRQSVEALINSAQFQRGNKIGRSVSDCCERAGSSEQGLHRTRSLTDEDLDELRGCIDLGFGFSNVKLADPKLWETFPALELCYAVSQQLKEDKNRTSPVSVLDSDALVDASKDKPVTQPVAGSWTISSPGDHPQVIKDRLRHWAQAVAFNIRQKL